MADLTLQPSISTDLRSQAHLNLINRLKALDLTPILVYRILSLPDSAVLAMAWQFDVLNPLLLPDQSQDVTLAYSSWDVITNIDTLINLDQLLYTTQENVPLSGAALYAQYRLLIQLSTALHSIMGTPQAILNALTKLGFSNSTIQEGQNSWGGTQWPASQGWAVFRVLVDLSKAPTGANVAQLIARVTAIANFWKPARCWLDSVQFQRYLTDTLLPAPLDFLLNAFGQSDFLLPVPSEVISAPAWPETDQHTLTPLYNTRYYFSGITYGQNEPHIADGSLVINGVAVSH